MDLTAIADAIAWSLLVPSLLGAAVLSVIAFLRPRQLFVWIATAALVVAVVAATSLSAPAAPGTAAFVSLVSLVVAVFGGGPAATTALALAMGPNVTAGLHGGIVVADRVRPGEHPVAEGRREVLRGGLTIGVLERIGAAGSIMAGFPEGLAIVVAVKGVGRFTELEAPEARERFIIGTFASLIWACAAAFVTHAALS